jgi:DNA primase catalytic core
VPTSPGFARRHEDREPSLKVTPGKNLWHCFGCGAGGGPIDWVMKRRGVSFRHAVELLRERSGVAPEGVAEAPASSLAAASPAAPARLVQPVSLDEDDASVLSRVVEYYHACLKRSPAALAYLEKRGIADPAAIDTFRLGFADRTLGLRLPDKRRREGAELRSRLERVGLYRASGHEHFCGSLVVPILDETGQVVGMYGRKIGGNLRAGTPLHLYLPGPHRGVWNVPGIASAPDGEVILCEALLDALTFWCAGYRYVTASYGAEGFTDAHLAAFQAHGIKQVLIAYDPDAAGERGAAAVAERLAAAGIASGRIEFPHGLDANAYALKTTPAAKSLGVLLRRAGGAVTANGPAAETGTDEAAAKEEGPVFQVEDPLPSLAAAMPVAPLSVPSRPPTLIEAGANEATIRFGDRRWRVRGLDRATGGESLKLNVMATCEDAGGTCQVFHVDTLDLYSARARAGFVEAAAAELGVPAAAVKADLGQVLLAVEELLDARAAAAAQPEAPPAPSMSPAERAAALAFLCAPDLLDRIEADFEACGLVGEATNRLVAYLACVSRKLAAPLAVLVQSSSAAGKTSLMDAVLAFVPEAERVRYSAMTGQALFYMGARDLKHRVLALCEEEGASRAAYALKLLQSDGSLTIASTGKDPATGALTTQDYCVQGPVMLFLTTTAIELDEELLNRCLVLSVDEGRAQTEAIHKLQRQRRTLDGLLARQARDSILALHRTAQSLLAPLAVVNPYADRLTFLSDRTRARRDHEKYLTLIDTIALLHQHQRPVRQPEGGPAYVEVTVADIAAANRLAHEVLGRSLDALPPQSRRLLGLLTDWVLAQALANGIKPGEVRFTRRKLREATGWGDTQLKIHLARLAELEHLLVHRAERGQGFVYELLYDGPLGDGAAPHLSGLIDPAALMDGYDARRSGLEAARSPAGRAVAGGLSVPGRGEAAAKEAGGSAVYADVPAKPPESLFPAKGRLNGSHMPAPALASAAAPTAL